MSDNPNDSLATKPWQTKISRRRFLGGGLRAGWGRRAGRLPAREPGSGGQSSAASRGPFHLSEVKHLVFLMQENRSFDHYLARSPG